MTFFACAMRGSYHELNVRWSNVVLRLQDRVIAIEHACVVGSCPLRDALLVRSSAVSSAHKGNLLRSLLLCCPTLSLRISDTLACLRTQDSFGLHRLGRRLPASSAGNNPCEQSMGLFNACNLGIKLRKERRLGSCGIVYRALEESPFAARVREQ